MRLLIDMIACLTEGSRNRGIGRYSLALARAMVEEARNVDFRFLANRNYPAESTALQADLADLVSADRFFHHAYPTPDAGSSASRRAASVAVERKYAELSPDILHVTSLFDGFGGAGVTMDRGLSMPGVLSAVTLYDLIPLIYKNIYLGDTEVRHWYYRRLRLLQQFDIILSISEATRSDAIDRLDLFPDRVVNISGAVDDCFYKRNISAEANRNLRERFKIKNKFFMYTGGIDYRKNLERAVDAFGQIPVDLRDEWQFLIVCAASKDHIQALTGRAKSVGLRTDDLIMTGFVSDEDLVLLYNLCDAFVFPSIYEGFGLPVLEAMKCGAPVIAADGSSIPEVIGRRDALFDPHHSSSIADAMAHVIREPEFRADLARTGIERSKLFTWRQSARTALDAFVEARRRRADVPLVQGTQLLPRRRLAFFSPLPPVKSGISSYSAELLHSLHMHFDIDLFTDQPTIDDEWIVANFQKFSLSAYGELKSKYDTSLFHLGNSAHHRQEYDLICASGGIVVLHDFYLTGLIDYIDVEGRLNFFDDEAIYSHGDAVEERLKVYNHRLYIIQEYPCNRRIIDRSDGIIVHSQHAFDLAEQFYPGQVQAPFRLIRQARKVEPIAPIHRRDELRAALGFATDDFLICSFGFVAASKGTETILEALTHAAVGGDKRVKLVFVGGLDNPDYQLKIDELVERLDLRDRFRITGFLDDAAYQQFFQVADIAIQLRSSTRGETSRAVLDCLAHGLATIVNDFATFTDYPDDVVRKVPADLHIDQIAAAIDELHGLPERRRTFAEAGRRYLAKYHAPSEIAAAYALAIHDFVERRQLLSTGRYAEDLGRIFAAGAVSDEIIDAYAALTSQQF